MCCLSTEGAALHGYSCRLCGKISSRRGAIQYYGTCLSNLGSWKTAQKSELAALLSSGAILRHTIMASVHIPLCLVLPARGLSGLNTTSAALLKTAFLKMSTSWALSRSARQSAESATSASTKRRLRPCWQISYRLNALCLKLFSWIKTLRLLQG